MRWQIYIWTFVAVVWAWIYSVSAHPMAIVVSVTGAFVAAIYALTEMENNREDD